MKKDIPQTNKNLIPILPLSRSTSGTTEPMATIRQPSEALLRSPDGGVTFVVRWASASAYSSPDVVQELASATARGLQVLFEDDSLLVVDKPSFLPCENTRELKDSVRARVEAHLVARDGAAAAAIHLPHRLDWETSGLLVVAKSSAAMASLSRQFSERRMAKVYVADVIGAPPAREGTVDLPLSSDRDRLPRQRVDFGPSGKPALTRWSVLSAGESSCRLRLEPTTGRRHQLRLHLAALGCAIVGDSLYAEGSGGSDGTSDVSASAAAGAPATASGAGDMAPASSAAGSGGGEVAAPTAWAASSSAPGPSRLHLHAVELGFSHPTSGSWLAFRSQPPFHADQGGL